MDVELLDVSVVSTPHLVKLYHMGAGDVPFLRGVTLERACGDFSDGC